MTWLFPLLVVLFAVISLALVLIILVQRPQGGGLASAFGGGGNQDTAFGGRTGDALTIATVSTFVLWLLVAIGLNVTDHTMGVAPAAETPAADAATAEASAADPAAPITLEPQPLAAEEAAKLLSPTAPEAPPSAAPSGVITPDRPVVQPGLEGLPGVNDPKFAPPPAPAEPAPAPAPAPAP